MEHPIMNRKLRLLMYLFLITFGSLFRANAQDWANLNKYTEANKMIDRTSNLQKRVVFMGNSITEGWVTNDPDFFTKNNIVGRGISGQTTPQMLLRFRQDVIDLNPQVVVILAGTNDIAGNTGPMTEAQIVGNIISMAELAETNSIKVIIASILPAAKYPWKPEVKSIEPIKRINNQLQAYAKRKEFIYLDYYSAMVNASFGIKDPLSYDGVHPTLAGYKIMEPLALIAIESALKK